MRKVGNGLEHTILRQRTQDDADESLLDSELWMLTTMKVGGIL